MPEKLQPRTPGWYYRLSSFFKEHFSGPVYKIPLHSGFSCPNRDGAISQSGCSYCYNPSFSPFSGESGAIDITAQLAKGKKKNKPNARYLAYFQSYTNTYAPVETLQLLYDQALADPEVVGLSVATRPDCISEEVLGLLQSYAQNCHLWIEYGLQSCHDSTLNRINRGHSAADFANAVGQTRGRGLFICAHIILGLPGETTAMFAETIDYINKCAVDGIKFHHLQIIKHTTLARQHAIEPLEVFETAESYIRVLCDCLEKLSPKIVVERLAGQATSKELLISPHWPESAGQIATLTEKELKRRGSFQGAKFINGPFFL